MIFITDNLKYDTDKMELISDKIKVFVECSGFRLEFARKFNSNPNGIYGSYFNGKIYKSKKSRYIAVYEYDYEFYGRPMSEKEVKETLKRYDYLKYEELFGKIKEA